MRNKLRLPLTISPGPPDDSVTLALATDDQAIATALASPTPEQSWFWVTGLLLAVLDGGTLHLATTDPGQASHLPAALAANQLVPTALIAPPAPAASFVKAYQKRTRTRQAPPTPVTRYRSPTAPSTPSAKGYLRYAVARDHKLLADWATAPDFPITPEQLTTALGDRHVVLWDVESAPVALAAFAPPTASAAALTALYTVPSARQHHYASSLLSALAIKLAPDQLTLTTLGLPLLAPLLTRLGYTEDPALQHYQLS